MTNSWRPATVLAISGSDSGSGAGMQQDLKTIHLAGSYGLSLITAITAQNTQAVTDIEILPSTLIESQFEAITADFPIDAVKIGMLGQVSVIESLAKCLERKPQTKIILDPVMIAKSGDSLLSTDAVASLKQQMLPRADCLTPNLPEAEVLVGFSIHTSAQMIKAAEALLKYTPAVVLKGGHFRRDDDLISDLYLDRHGNRKWLNWARVPTRNHHGTGCFLSSAIAAYWAQGGSLYDAVIQARALLQSVLLQSATMNLGQGARPMWHPYSRTPSN